MNLLKGDEPAQNKAEEQVGGYTVEHGTITEIESDDEDGKIEEV